MHRGPKVLFVALVLIKCTLGKNSTTQIDTCINSDLKDEDVIRSMRYTLCDVKELSKNSSESYQQGINELKQVTIDLHENLARDVNHMRKSLKRERKRNFRHKNIAVNGRSGETDDALMDEMVVGRIESLRTEIWEMRQNLSELTRAMAGMVQATIVRPVCPEGYSYLRGANSCYAMQRRAYDWRSADRGCSSHPGGRLLVIQEMDDFQAVSRFLKLNLDPRECVTPFTCKWFIADVPPRFTRWQHLQSPPIQGMPYSRSSQCRAMTYHGPTNDLSFVSVSCGQGLSSVCEIRPSM